MLEAILKSNDLHAPTLIKYIPGVLKSEKSSLQTLSPESSSSNFLPDVPV